MYNDLVGLSCKSRNTVSRYVFLLICLFMDLKDMLLIQKLPPFSQECFPCNLLVT